MDDQGTRQMGSAGLDKGLDAGKADGAALEASDVGGPNAGEYECWDTIDSCWDQRMWNSSNIGQFQH